jgi:integrase/recombinase XerC
MGKSMPYLSPPTMTRAEQEALLRVSASHPRDHLVFSLALGTGLRLAEIVGLDVGDVFFSDGAPRTRVRLRREIAKGGRAGDLFLPDALIPKMRRFWRFKQGAGESLGADAALFCNQAGDRISKRRVQIMFREWQVAAGFSRLYPFHATRHTAVTNVYRASRDLFLAQRFARHVSPLTTVIYTHVSDEELQDRLRAIAC